jgi:hypothetical protein
MGWLDRLSEEISREQGRIVTVEELYKQFSEFRESQQDPLLRASYPPDIHHFRRAERPQTSTRDIILSFMEHRYGGVHVPMVSELAADLDEVANKNPRATELERILVKERLRRYAAGPKRDSTYWGINSERLRKKYEGFYALLRVDSGGNFQVEPFALSLRDSDPTTISAYWVCDQHPRVGDLLVNTYRLSGLTVCKSTDDVIEPVSISLLRARRGGNAQRKRPLILGGFAVGWKDNDPAALFHCRIAVIKLGWEHRIRSGAEFVKAANNASLEKTLGRLRKHKGVVTQFKPRFLGNPNLAMNPLDAHDALSGIGQDFVTVV